MPKLLIDNIPVEAAEGVSVLEAAQSVGIPIPHFCYHPALGKAGACRLCAVKMLEGPIKGIQMSCMLEVQEGMVVSTTDPEAVAMRRQVIEWLMINHPHDCPVCDEGGECQLQDFTIAGGHGLRSYTGKKRTHHNQDLGPFIQHEMNRCIQCYRCVRFYKEYAGGTDFGAMGNAGRVYFGRFEDGKPDSPFSGNLMDVCPTGVFTDKTARFRARYWDYQMAPSVCPHCSLGCNTIPAARYRELLKVVARRNDAVNGWFICDRGRFTNSDVNSPDRPRYPLVNGRQEEWDDALDQLLNDLREICEPNGGESLAIVGSSRLSMEGATLLHHLAGNLPAGSLCYFVDDHEADQAVAAASQTKLDTASMAEVQDADLIVMIDCAPFDDGPMMALAIRQAWRKGAQVFQVGSDSEEKGAGLPFTWQTVSSLRHVPLETANRPVIICGSDGAGVQKIAKEIEHDVKLVCMLAGPNGFGAARLMQEHGATTLARAIAANKVKAILAIEADIPSALLEGRVVVGALDWRRTPTVEAARTFLPTTAWVEMDGTYINNEGRAQRFTKVMQPGLPIRGLNPALHPPRQHSLEVPGGEPRPAWEIVTSILERLGVAENKPLSGKWAVLQELDPEGEGLVVKP